MSKIRFVLLLSLFVLSGIVAYGAILGKSYVTPENFGAQGDGKTDDSKAISKCIQSGKTIRLSPNKTYLLENPVKASNSETLRIEGNGAKIVVSEKFPMKGNDIIFYFGTPRKKLLEVKDLYILCLLDQKFPEKTTRGDTYVFAVESCDEVRFKNVKFKSERSYNNVTFLRNNGSKKMEMEDCNIVLNTMSVQGGILWFMNRRDSICSVSLKNSYFEHDVKDECMCFSIYKEFNKEKCKMIVNVENCEFYSKGESSSSGFILVYSNSKKAFSNLNVNYKKCSFKTDGTTLRRIQGYQICDGESDFDYGVFHTTYDQCKFDFLFKKPKTKGLLGLLCSKGTSMSADAIVYRFNQCEFNLHNISPLIDDNSNNLEGKGIYEFNSCKIVSDGCLFEKKFTPTKGDVRIRLNDCDLVSNDEVLSTEFLIAKNCRFTNKIKTPLPLMNKKSKIENCTINKINYKK